MVTNHASTMPPDAWWRCMVTTLACTIRLAHGCAVVIAAWRPTSHQDYHTATYRIDINHWKFPNGAEPYMRYGPTWLMTLVDRAPYGRTLVGNRTVHAPMCATMHLPPAWSSTLVGHHTVLQWQVTMWHKHMCQQPYRCPHNGAWQPMQWDGSVEHHVTETIMVGNDTV
jgi:hypothetical protein